MRTSTTPRRALLTTTDAITEALIDATEAYEAALTLARSNAVQQGLEAAFDAQVLPLLDAASAVTRRSA